MAKLTGGISNEEFIARLSRESDYSPGRVNRVLKALATVVYEAMTRGEKVKINGLGYFVPTPQKARMRYSIRTKTFKPSAARIQIRFRMQASVKKKLIVLVARRSGPQQTLSGLWPTLEDQERIKRLEEENQSLERE